MIIKTKKHIAGPLERRGNMVYTEETRPGKAVFIAECVNAEAARLFSSAPDLLSAVKSILPLLDSGLDAVENWQVEADAIRSAIQKAEGRE